MKYDILKQFRKKKKFLQNFDFLFVWNANFVIYNENFLFVIILKKKRFFQMTYNLIYRYEITKHDI